MLDDGAGASRVCPTVMACEGAAHANTEGCRTRAHMLEATRHGSPVHAYHSGYPRAVTQRCMTARNQRWLGQHLFDEADFLARSLRERTKAGQIPSGPGTDRDNFP
jgi:hypothetical protein